MGTGKVKSVASNSEGISTCPSENKIYVRVF
jgi:hypothetical protein